MMTSQQVVSTYEAMVAITGQMLQAATDSDWDRLADLERQCAAHVRALKESEPVQPLVGANRTRKVEAIRKMLDDDRKIRDLTTPWMARLSAMISNAGAERRLARAYGA
ncbi:MAG: flagellar protein FliT [Gammaproteobacteria bacterium]